MNQERDWSERRIELICTHLVEYEKLTITALKVARSINDDYDQEKLQLKPGEKSQSLMRQVERVTALIRSNGLKRTALFVRQRKEMIDFNKRVDFEKNWYPGVSYN